LVTAGLATNAPEVEPLTDLVVTYDNLDDLVDGYFAHYHRLISSKRADRLAAQDGDPLGEFLMFVGPGVAPEIAWDAVVALLDRAPDADALAFVISGPLQDLVTYHAEQFADRLVERCRQDAGFRVSMASLYRRHEVPPELQSRLAAVIENGP
jgi:hypothetical protein